MSAASRKKSETDNESGFHFRHLYTITPQPQSLETSSKRV